MKSNESFIEGPEFKKEDLNYPQLLRFQLNRVGMAGIIKVENPTKSGLKITDYIEVSVNVLVSMLYPYTDDKFLKLRTKVTDKGYISPYDLLSCCVDLMHRRGLLLKETIEVTEE